MTTQPVMEDLERLASRLAMLTSEEGEADNAGRAVGQLARRLGLSGGQIKAIFLAGVQAAGVPVPPPEAPFDPEALARAEGEAEELRRLLDRSDLDLQLAQQQLADAQDENERLRDRLDRARTTGRVLRVTALVLLLAAGGGGAVAWFAPGLRVPDGMPPSGSSLRRMAVAGASGADLFRAPDLTSDVAGRLPAGAALPVRQLLWRNLTQWVETESMGQTAYAPATQVDLR